MERWYVYLQLLWLTFTANYLAFMAKFGQVTLIHFFHVDPKDVFSFSIGSPGYVRLRTCCFFILPKENERSLWAVRSKTQYQVIQIWPFDPLFGGHQHPFKGSRIRTPQKGHQQNCQLFLNFLLFLLNPPLGIFVQDFLDMLFWDWIIWIPCFGQQNFVVENNSNKNRPCTIHYTLQVKPPVKHLLRWTVF